MTRTAARISFTVIAAAVLAAAGMAGQAATPDQIPVIPKEVPKFKVERIWAAAPEKPHVAPKRARRVLIFLTPAHLMEKDPHKGYCIPYGTVAFQALGLKTGAFEPVVSDDVSLFAPESLKKFDAIVLNNTSGPWIKPTPEVAEKLKEFGDAAAVEEVLKKSLMDFVSGGGGLFGIHYGMSGNNHWPEFKTLFNASYWGHPWNEEVGVKLDEANHPLVAGFGGQSFRVADEIFQFNTPYSRETQRVLLSLDVEKTNMTVQWIHRTDKDFALSWIRAHGKGRVFYCAIGHREEIYRNPAILQYYLAGIQFATGDLEAPMEPVKK